MPEQLGAGAVFTATQDGVLIITLDETVYSREAILRACYWFTERAYLYITRPRAGYFEVQLKLKRVTLAEPASLNVSELGGEFLNLLLDHQLRQDIEAQTGKIRELLVAKAFAEAGVLEDRPPGDPADSVESEQQKLVSMRMEP